MTASARTTISRPSVNGQGEERMWRRFLDRAPAMHADLEVRGKIGFRPYPTAPDYRQDMPGAAAGWRPLEPLPFDGRELGDDFAMVAPPIPELTLFGGMMVTRGEAAMLLKADRSIEAASLGVRLTARYLLDRIRHKRGTRLVIGNALVARLLKAVLDRGVTVCPRIETVSLRRSCGRVNGVEVQYGKRSLTVATRKGVVLAGGGFPASPSWRARELPEPTAQYTPAAPGCVGRTIELGLEAGGVLGPAGMDNALWFPSSIAKRADGTTAVYPHIILDRAKPGSIIVDRSGQRFANEAVSYHEFVRAMYRANQTSHSVPAWMICDREFIRRYGLGLIRPRSLSLRRQIDNGYLTEAADAEGLAEKIGAPADALRETIERVNRFAGSGVDEDFQRGSSIYDRAGGDPEHRPNPLPRQHRRRPALRGRTASDPARHEPRACRGRTRQGARCRRSADRRALCLRQRYAGRVRWRVSGGWRSARPGHDLRLARRRPRGGPPTMIFYMGLRSW